LSSIIIHPVIINFNHQIKFNQYISKKENENLDNQSIYHSGSFWLSSAKDGRCQYCDGISLYSHHIISRSQSQNKTPPLVITRLSKQESFQHQLTKYIITFVMTVTTITTSQTILTTTTSSTAMDDSATMSLTSMMSKQPHAPIVIALGGNALLKRGELMTMDNQRRNVAQGMQALAPIILQQSSSSSSPPPPSPDNKDQKHHPHPIVIVHGNGPQVGLLMLESATYEKSTGLPQLSLDVLDAETEGMIGYLIEQELQRQLHSNITNNNNDNSNVNGYPTSTTTTRGMVTVLSQIVCDPSDPAFDNPTNFVGPVYTKEEGEKLGLPVKPDGNQGHYRRVVPSPHPVKMIESQLIAIQTLIDNDCIVICAGGGGIPVVEDPNQTGRYTGIEAVIDKDRAAAMVGQQLGAQGLLILTDVSAVSINFGLSNERRIKRVSPFALKKLMDQGHFPAGSMGPKVESAIHFVVQHTKTTHTENNNHKNDNNNNNDKSSRPRWAAIGALKEADQIMAGTAGTIIIWSGENQTEDMIEFYDEQ
jgi:carbamate kinase